MATISEIKQNAERTANDNSIIAQLASALEAAQKENAELKEKLAKVEEQHTNGELVEAE